MMVRVQGMEKLMLVLWIMIAAAVVVAGYIRLAPSDPMQWHVEPAVSRNSDQAGGVRRMLEGDADTLYRLHNIIMDSDRTEMLAGSPADGMITYVTRSRIMGFPDYTTVWLDRGQIKIFARLRFGKSDLGVNAARVDGWLAILQAG